MDFNERVIPNISSNFSYQESLARYEFVKKFIKKGFKILDVGCGTGYGTSYLSKFANVTGIDINAEAINYARNKFPGNTEFFVGDVQKIGFADNIFDILVSFEVIEHLDKPQNYLSEVKRVLKNNGSFIMSTPNAKSVKHRSMSPYHVKEYRFCELKSILSSYFKTTTFFGQRKSRKAIYSYDDFLKSQRTRQVFVDFDIFNIRKLFPSYLKEKVWRTIGGFFGRNTQKQLHASDFPISRININSSEYLIAVCKK